MVERGPRFFSGRQLAPGGIVSRGFVILILCVGVAGAVLLGFVFEQRLATADEYHRQVRLALEEAKRIREQVILPQHEKLSAGQNLKAALEKFGLSAQEAAGASAAAEHAFNLRQLRAGNSITVGRSVEGRVREIDYKIDLDRLVKILAAEYENAGRRYQALLFHDPAGRPGYYAADGKSLAKAFLRSPLKFGAPVTSHFSRSRFHPILKIYRPHLGTDYGAPVGTPVQTIGSGRVLFAGRKSGEGNMIEIAHFSGYKTRYLHLSRMFVHPGERVEIGRTIGLVGSTGLATGPHLDFRILERGQYKNFEKLSLPPSDPVAKRNWPDFSAAREKWLPLLRNPGLLEANAGDSNAERTH